MDVEAEKELLLWRRYRESGDGTVRDALLARHLPYARVVAATFFARRFDNDVEFADYLQLARVGLLEAFDRYDPTRGAQFRTFAALRMRGAILDGLTASTEKHSQLSARQRMLAARTASVAAEAHDQKGSGEVLSYLAEVGMALAIGFMLEDTPLFQPAEESFVHGDPVYHAVEIRRLSERIRTLVGRLPLAERDVIHGHYLQGLPFEEIATMLGLSRGRVSQIHKQALASLRSLIAAHQPCDFSA